MNAGAMDEAQASRAAIEALPVGVAVYDGQQRLVFANAVMHTTLDAAPGTAEIMALDLAHPQRGSRRLPDGRTIEVRIAPLPDGGHVAVVNDLSDLVEAQAELERRAALMDSIVNHVPLGISVYGPDRTLGLVNAAYARIMEGAPIVLGDTIEQIIDRRAKAGEYGEGDPVERATEQRGRSRAMLQVRRRRRPSGNTIDIRTAPLPGGGHISVVTDVTPLVEAEAELARRAASMDAMLANIRHGIVLWDADRRIIASNRVAAELVGAPPGHFAPGRTLEQVNVDALARGALGEGDVAESRARRLMQQDRTQSHTDQRLTRAGRILEVRSDPTPDGGFVTTYTDVTQRREAEDALRLAKSAAEAANTAKSRFLAAMSTELRSPVIAIQAELARLQRDAAASRSRGFGAGTVEASHVQLACDAAGEAARRLLTLVESVLDVARLEAGRLELSDGLVDIPQLVRACLRKSDSAAAAAELALVVDLPDALPLVRADEKRLGQALGHLVANAIRFTPALGSISIGARQEWASGDLLLTVQDTGVGIEAARLGRVFEPFGQLGSQTGGGGRAGLGLYVSRTLMRAHGGDLVLRSVPGEGTEAVLRIPAARITGGETD